MFRAYCELGEVRTLQKVADRLRVRHQAVSKMSQRWDWTHRVTAYDNWIAQGVNERVAHRLALQADRYSQLADDELKRTTRLDGLHDAVVCSKISAELAGLGKSGNGETQPLNGEAMLPPVLVTSQIPERPGGYCYVRVSDEPLRWTWIPLQDAPRTAREHPNTGARDLVRNLYFALSS